MNTDINASAVSRMLNARSVAIIGMSSKPGSSGQIILDHLQTNSYRGDIHLVGRSGGQIAGIPVLQSVDLLPPEVDLALVALPAPAVREAIEGCVRRRVGVAVVYASGFAEMGADGRAEQGEIARIAREGGLHLAGPNCIGFTNYVNPLNTVFLPDEPITTLPAATSSAVAILTQSGGLMGLLYQGLTARGLSVSYRITTGNEADLTLADYLDYLAEDPVTAGVIVYAEDIRDPQGFLDGVRAMRARSKTVTLMHSGRSERARHAAASHTGALAADYGLMKTMVTRAGAFVAESLEELMDVTEILARFPVPPTGGIAVATTSGAFCAIALDTLADSSTDAVPLSSTTRETLATRLPGYITPNNPLDLSTAVVTDPALFHDAVAALLADDSIGSVSLAVPFVDDRQNREMLAQVTRAAAGQPKPVVIGMFGDVRPIPDHLRRYAADHGVVLSSAPERSLRALAALSHLGKSLSRPIAPNRHERYDGFDGLSGSLAEWQGKDLLRTVGIPVPDGGLATSLDEALTIAARIGYPVVAKAQSANLLHKTESGGLVLGITDDAALRSAYLDLTTRLSPLDGILVETMVNPGLELMVGATRHPSWGPVVMAGLGGVWVEALRDVRILPPDLPPAEIVSELFQLRSATLLGPFRGSQAIDVDAVAAVIASVGQLMLAHPEIVELDINPLLCRPDGVTALDALVVLTEHATPQIKSMAGIR